MKFSVRLPEAGEDLSNLASFDHTKLNAIDTCNRWGIIRYGKSLSSGSGARAMALEAGHACHEVFSAVRLFDLLTGGGGLYPDKDIRRIVALRAGRIFGEQRADEYMAKVDTPGEDDLTRIKIAALHILETSGFYDEPSDKRRTLQRLGEAILVFIERYRFGKSLPYISSDDSFVGVENTFELVVDYSMGNASRHCVFYGRIDGCSCYRNDPTYLTIDEYKTSSRLNDAWYMSFETSHQVTGYLAAMSVLTGTEVRRAQITGLAIPQPVKSGEGIMSFPVRRSDYQFTEWIRWFITSAEKYYQYIDDVFEAPMMTGQCNRYFRPCSFIPLCAARDKEERDDLYKLLEYEPWSPLEDKSND